MKKNTSYNNLVNSVVVIKRTIVSQIGLGRSLRGKGGLKLFLGVSFLVISILFFNNNSFSQGYTTPVDANSNGIYDFREAGNVPVITTQPTDSVICANVDASFSVIATGSDLIYQWQVSIDSGSNYSNITVPGSTPTYSGFTSDELSLTGASIAQDGYFYRVIVYSETFTCDSVISNVADLTVNASPSAPIATAAQDFCSSESHLVSDLSVTASSPSWYDVPVGGSPLAIGTTLVTGSYYVTETITSCESARTEVTVNILATPSAPSAVAQVFCSDENADVSDLAATGTNLSWFSVATGGTALASSELLTSAQYYVSQTVGSCESSRTMINVSVTISPPAPTSSDRDFCDSESHLVSDLSATGTSLQWYTVSTGSTALLAGTTLATGSYYVSQTVGTCESPRSGISVTVSTTPSAPTVTAAQDFCAADSHLVSDLIATGTNLQWYSVSTGGTPLALGTTLATGNYYVSQTVGSCESNRIAAAVEIFTTPGIPLSGDQDFCSVDNPQVGDLSVTGTLTQWYENSSGGSPLANATALSSGSYYVTQTIDGCESPRRFVNVTVNTTLSEPVATSPQSFCSGSTYNVSDLSATGSGLQWYNVSAGGTALLSTDVISTGSYYVSQTAMGCESTRLQVEVSIDDTENPVVTCNPFTLNLDNSGNGTLVSSDILNTVTDNCSTPTLALSQVNFTCLDIGANSIIVTATDADSNTSSCTSIVTVLETAAPVVTCQDYIAQLDATGNVTVTSVNVVNTSSDNCSVPTLSLDIASFDCSNIGQNTVTVSATDASSNIATCTSTVTVADNINPSVTCVGITVNLDGTGNASIVSGDIVSTSSDNCAAPSLSIDITSFNCSDIGTNNVTLTASDAQGNSASCTSDVTVIDNLAPTALCLDITVGLDNDDEANVAASAVNNGSSDNCGIQNITLSPSFFDDDDYGPNNVTLTITDDNGLVSTCSSIITISNSNPPNAICQDINIYLDASGNVSMMDEDIDGGSTDNGTIVTYAAAQTAFTCLDLGVNPVSLEVTDDASLSNSCSASVTVLDTINPVVVCQDFTLPLDNSGLATVIAPDIIESSSDNCTSLIYNLNQSTFNCSNLGANNVILTGADPSGNLSSCSAVVTIIDNLAPVPDVASLPSIDVECIVELAPLITFPTATDNCGGTGTGAPDVDLATLSQGSYIVTWSYTDLAGNVSTQSQAVNILDVTAPVPTVASLSDVIGACSVASFAEPTAVDNCTGTINGTTSTSFPITSSTVITWTYVDGNGNTSTQDQNIIINDSTDPIIPTLSDIVEECTVTAVAPTTTDNCAGTITGTTSDPLIYNSQGVHVITWTFDDGNGNVVTVDQNVIVMDTTEPDAPVLTDINGECSATAPTPITNDNCAGIIIGSTSDPLTYNTQGVHVITWLFDDSNGNVINVTQNVIIDDNTDPVAICQDATLVIDSITNDVTIDQSFIDNSSFDNCGIGSMNLSGTVFGTVGIYNTTLTVIDNNGNESSCTSQVDVIEPLDAPVAVCQDTILSLQNDGTISMANDAIDNGSFDNGVITGMTSSQTDFTCADIGDNIVTLLVEDDEGNFGQCDATVTVIDEILPTVTCQNVTIYLDSLGDALINNFDVVTSFSDNCGGTSINLSQGSFDGTNLGYNEVNVVVTDDFGNADSCIAEVMVLDNIPPTIGCVDIAVPLDINGEASVQINTLDSIGYDNSDQLIYFSGTLNFTCGEIGDTTYLLTAQDLSGNTSSCTGTISVVDNLAPTILCQDFILELDDFNQGSITISDAENGNSDNCGIDSLSIGQYDFDENDIGSNDIVLTAVDIHGNTSTCIANVQVNSTLAPIAVCQDITLSLDANGFVSIIAAEVDGGSTDANGQISLTVSQDEFTCADIGDHMVTLIVENIFDVRASCDATVSIIDDTSPVLTCPTDKIFPNDIGQCGAMVNYGSVSSDDNCAVSLELINGALNNTFFDVGITSIEYRATDLSGNEAFCSFSVEVTDSEAPQITCPEDIYTMDEVVIYDSPAFDDNCVAELVQIEGSTTGSVFNHGYNPQTYIATDDAGLSSECSFIIMVNSDVVAVNDSVSSVEGVNIAIDALFNDYDPDGDDFSIITANSTLGEVMIVEGKELVYIPESDWCGTDSIFYEIEDIYGSRSFATIYVEVSCEVQVFIPEGFSPNNDGVNDFFEIVGIENYPQAELNIYNRWSHIVYESVEYDNSWDGTTINPLTLGKKIVPIGTYFYNLKIDDDTIIKGYFYISR